MNTSPKRIAALILLDEARVCRSSAAPAVFKIFWAFGLDVPTPHFISFTRVAAIAGFSFGVLWGLSMFAFSLPRNHTDPGPLLITAAFACLLFGISMATYYAHGRRKHKLPRWSSFSSRMK
jgi:hypothetical protein